MERRACVAVGKCGYLLDGLFVLCSNYCTWSVERGLRLGNVDIYWTVYVYCVVITERGA